MKTWTVNDVMTSRVASVFRTASYREMVDLLARSRISAVPVIAPTGRVLGVVSEADLLRKIEYAGNEEPRVFDAHRRRDDRHKSLGRTAADLMSAPAVTVTAGTSIAAAARTMDRYGVKRLPVVDDAGLLVGIVSRADLLKTHLRGDREILADIETDVLDTFLADEAETVTVAVVDGVVTLSGKVDRWSSAELAERLSREVAGVVGVTSTLDYSFDDRNVHGARPGLGTL